jgi:hypothetical protein
MALVMVICSRCGPRAVLARPVAAEKTYCSECGHARTVHSMRGCEECGPAVCKVKYMDREKFSPR